MTVTSEGLMWNSWCVSRTIWHIFRIYMLLHTLHTFTHPPPAVTLKPSSNPAVFQPLWLSACHTHTCKYFFLCPLPIQRAFGMLLSHPGACCVGRVETRSDPPELLHRTLTHYYDILLSCHCVFSKDSHAILYNYDEYFIEIVLHWWIAFKSLLCDLRWANDIRCSVLVQRSSFQPTVVV